MIENIYTNTMVISLSLYLFMGGYLICGKIPEILKGSMYQKSRVIAGLVYVILGVEVAVVSFFNFRLTGSEMAAALGLCTYYLIAILFSYSFTRLLGDKHYFSRKRMRISLACWSTYTIGLMLSLHLCNDQAKDIVMNVAATIYVGMSLLQTWYFFKTYKSAIARAENYFSESVEQVVQWMPIATYNIVILGLSAGLLVFGGPILIVCYTIYAVILLVYIFAKMTYLMIELLRVVGVDSTSDTMEFMLDDSVEDEERADEEIHIDEHLLNQETFDAIKQKLDNWIDEKGFFQSDVSINTMSREMGTNRTYLSKYINWKYNLNFRDWILMLRLDEAKRLIKEEKRHSMSYVATHTGFSSTASFTRAFTRKEGVSPAKWRDMNVEQNNI